MNNKLLSWVLCLSVLLAGCGAPPAPVQPAAPTQVAVVEPTATPQPTAVVVPATPTAVVVPATPTAPPPTAVPTAVVEPTATTGCRCARGRWAPGRRLAARRWLLAGAGRRRAIRSAGGSSWLHNGSGHIGWRRRGGGGRNNHSGGRGWHNHSGGLRGGRWFHNCNLGGRSRLHRRRGRPTASQQHR